MWWSTFSVYDFPQILLKTCYVTCKLRYVLKHSKTLNRIPTSCSIWGWLTLWWGPPGCCWACEGEEDQEAATNTHHRLFRSLFSEHWLREKSALCPLLWFWQDWNGLNEVKIKKVTAGTKIVILYDASFRSKVDFCFCDVLTPTPVSLQVCRFSMHSVLHWSHNQ